MGMIDHVVLDRSDVKAFDQMREEGIEVAERYKLWR